MLGFIQNKKNMPKPIFTSHGKLGRSESDDANMKQPLPSPEHIPRRLTGLGLHKFLPVLLRLLYRIIFLFV